MSDTSTNRKYAWGLQADYKTQKPLTAGALKQMIVTDNNVIEYTADVKDNEEWSHGYNSATDQWKEQQDSKVAHTMPGFAEELGKIFYLNLADYAVAAAGGGSVAKKHTFKPTDPNVTRQDPAVTYVEKIAQGWFKMMPRAVSDGFSLKGNAAGVLMCDFNLLGSGLIINNPAVTFAPTATPTVTELTGLRKLFNSQVSVTPNDGASYNSAYGCRYRSFALNFKKTMLDAAGYKPGCAEYFVTGDRNSGLIKSAHEFDKQMLDFELEVDLAASTPEFDAVVDQRPIAIVLDILSNDVIEAAIKNQLTVTINAARYTASAPTLVDNMWRFKITGKAFFDVTAANMFKIDLTNKIASYATGW